MRITSLIALVSCILLSSTIRCEADDELQFTERFGNFPVEGSGVTEQATEAVVNVGAIEVPLDVINYFSIFAPDRADESALRLTLAVRRSRTQFGVKLPELQTIGKLACIIRYESRANTHAVNRRTRCSGMLQIHPCHKRTMTKLGLDFGNEADRLVYGCIMFEQQGYKPWVAVQRRAKRDFRKHFAAFVDN